jgi:hypothetical protein
MSNNRLNRREFLSTLAASGLALGLGSSKAHAAASNSQTPVVAPVALPLCSTSTSRPLPSFGAEGERLTQACMSLFWDNDSKMFRAPVLSSETVPSDALHDRGYTLWPSLLGLHALVEGEKATPGSYTSRIATVFDGLEAYYSQDLRAYTSWIQFPGNNDAYYDDNSWVVIVFTEAALACRATDPQRSAQYLSRAQIVLDDFVVKGYDTTNHPGGMPWGTDSTKPNTSDRGTSSTGGAALAALVMARAGVNAEFNTKWGHDLLTWLSDHLIDPDGLVMDALIPPNWEVRGVKWTYNTGVPMRAYVEHYRLTQSPDSLQRASAMARAAIDQSGALFDAQIKDVANRQYWDGTYFVHYLVDGLLRLAEVTPDAKLAAAARDTVKRTAFYVQAYLQDPADGFYWRNMRLYTIDEPRRASFQRLTGQTIAPQYDASERSQEDKFAALAVQDRPLVKTLLANAGAARMFWLAETVASATKERPDTTTNARVANNQR